MDFWNEYEGKTIAGSYPLQKLLHPEGRNGFFSTSNGTGTPAVIRLTESLNDQDIMFAQWQAVRDLQHPNLVVIRSYGQTVVEEAPLLYALLEPADADLAEILLDRPMTAEETREIAICLVTAIQALHQNGLIHGHIEPSAVMAVGEVVKLRSDCVRVAPAGPEGDGLKALDVKALALLLLRALTGQSAATDSPLPAPFDQIVKHGVAGTWGLAEIAQALEPSGAPATAVPLSEVPEIQPVPRQVEATTISADPAATLTAAVEEPEGLATEEPAPAETGRDGGILPSGLVPWIGVALVLLAAILAWYYFNPLTPEQRAIAESKPSQASSSAPLLVPFSPNPAPAAESPAATTSAPVKPAPAAGAAAAGPVGLEAWRLVAYTYNREGQARARVASLLRRHKSLRPEVFTPTGHAPFLVTLGGPMSHEEAAALKRRAHSQGLPRDTYVQNYSTK